MLGRLKESAKVLREAHAAMATEWDAVMSNDQFTFAFVGDIHQIYVLLMSGHLGASCKYACLYCTMPREAFTLRSWVPAELTKILALCGPDVRQFDGNAALPR